MKRKIVLVVSVVAGLAAAVLTRFYLAAKDAEVRDMKDSFYRRYGKIRVLHFYREIPAGTVLKLSDLASKSVPAVGMRGQAVPEENASEIVGRKTLVTHKAGEVVFWSDIEGGDPSVKGLSDDVKKTMRAMSINCTGAASVSGMVKPNDHVDVIGTFDFEGSSAGKRNFVTCTILQNVLVLATGAETAKVRKSAATLPQAYSTVTLEVTPREAEMLAFAEQIKGRLVLTLRNRNDTSCERELPNVDFEKIRSEIEELNQKRQNQRGFVR